MVAGDFLEVYCSEANRGKWDCVATCFFIDTAHNVFQYVETIHHCLRDGGVWINYGPLLYHFAEMHGEVCCMLFVWVFPQALCAVFHAPDVFFSFPLPSLQPHVLFC